MTSRQQEKALFEEALDIADPIERRAFLDRACADQTALRRRLDRLLAAQEPAERLLGEGAIPARPAPDPAPSELLLDGEPDADDSLTGVADPTLLARSRVRIGRYRLLHRIGEGGCGVVYLAEQEEPVRRQVALKIIRLGMDTETVIARFELERQALAMMDHPHIARVLDAGATEKGRPYFVMERVQGVKITEYCDQHRLATPQRLALFVSVCQAIQHAHQKGIIHRDIKPSNILVEHMDGGPMPKVIDFGIAKAIDASPVDDPLLTLNVQMVGTPAYMSPEQAEPGRGGVDTRSDIYSLGVVLHELLTGRTPFDGKQLADAGPEAMRRTLREREPLRPSALLAALPPEELRAMAALRRADPARLLACVRGDLDCIVLNTLEKDRARRYETVNGLAMDIRRHLKNEPVNARPPSRVYRLQKLVRRNQAVFVAGFLVLLSLLAGLGASTWLFLRERDARREQVRLRTEAEQARAEENRLRRLAETREQMSRAAVHIRRGEFAQADALLAGTPLELIPSSLESADVLRGLGEWHALEGRWHESALRHLGLAHAIINADDSDSDDVSRSLLPAAAAIREHGSLKQYEDFRQTAARRFSDTLNPIVAEQVMKATLLSPADGFTTRALQPLADVVAATLDGQDPLQSHDPYMDAWRCFALALHAHRREQPDETLRWAELCLRHPSFIEPRTIAVNLLQAMSLRRMNRHEEADGLISSAHARLEERFRSGLTAGDSSTGFWFDWINARILLREAGAALED
jgi:eukaryotic-like serine/threonine-protein kinase